jgi:glycerate dehydrogenase
MNIVFLDAATLGDISFETICQYGTLTCYENSTPEEALERVRDCDILIINKIQVNAQLIDAAPHLKLICEAATGVNNIDLGYAESKGIPVRNAVGYSTDSVVQATLMHILSLAGHAPYYDDCVKSGRYSSMGMFTDPSVCWSELAGKTIGIIGMGNIGTRVAKVAEAFGMKVCYYSTSGTGHCKEYPCLSIEELMSKSDIVSIHAPLNERTSGLIGPKELSMMKTTGIIVNMGRGGIVDETALASAIDNGTIAGAALDVFVKEPLPADSPLLNTNHPERLRFTPHTAWASQEARERLVQQIADNIRQFVRSLE